MSMSVYGQFDYFDALSRREDATETVEPNEEAAASAQPEEELSQEKKSLLEKHEEKRMRCKQRTQELIRNAKAGINEEDFQMPPCQPQTDTSPEEEFPDSVVANMALLIEGR